MMYHLLMLSLLLSLVEVYSQTFPRLSYMGQTLADHSYVDISEVVVILGSISNQVWFLLQ